MSRVLPRLRFVIPLLAALLLSLAPAGQAQVVSTVVNLGGWGALEHGNGDKLATGRFNTLHAIYEDGGLIKYVTSSDGHGWSTPVLVSSTSSASALPAVTVDSAGTVAVAYVGQYNAATGLGKIYYAFKPLSGSWTQHQIVTHGTQPDITSYGRTVHLTWTTFDRVQYLSFATDTPPASPVAFGEEIDVNTCPGSRFVRPSIALVKLPCEPLEARVAYLVEFDETGNSDPVCASLETKIGPRVCRRDASGTWGLEWSDLLTATNPPAGIEAVSLSMSSNRRQGDLFLAWSDVSDGAARTRIAHGKNGAWAATTHDTERLEVHIQAKEGDPAAAFRFAWVDEGMWWPWASPDAAHRAGTWPSGVAPAWTDPAPVVIDWITIGRPQAEWWGRCTSGDYSRIRTFVEAEQVCANVRLATDVESGLACPPTPNVTVAYPCEPIEAVREVLQASSGGEDWIDTSELGVLVELGGHHAVYDAGLGELTRLEWTSGTVVAQWDGGFAATGLEDLRVVGDGVEPVIRYVGELLDYGDVCRDSCGCEEEEAGLLPVGLTGPISRSAARPIG